MNAAEAISAVAEHVRTAELDYPTEGLTADRFDTGWSVYASESDNSKRPFERPTFLVSDTGAIEQVSVHSRASGLSSLSSNSTLPMYQFGRTSEADGHDEVNSEEEAAVAAELLDLIAQQLISFAPDDWLWCRAEFALTVVDETTYVGYETPDGRQLQLVEVPVNITSLVREQRDISAGVPPGPWWRLVFDISNEGEIVIGYDYGDDPFPEDQLQPAQNYLDDIAAYPRSSLPVWLAAYLADPDVQTRDVPTAEAAVAADLAAGRAATPADDIAHVADMWARWTVLGALHMGVESEDGPRVTPGLGWYESHTRSGATLVLLPGDRAVLSGGRWESPLLAAAYLGDEQLPDLFAGAPVWVNEAVLNIRCQHGLLSFCYWWAEGRWWRGTTNTDGELDMALPPVWAANEETLAEMAEIAESANQSACESLLTAAIDGAVTVDQVIAVLSGEPNWDLTAALNQFAAAGLIQ